VRVRVTVVVVAVGPAPSIKANTVVGAFLSSCCFYFGNFFLMRICFFLKKKNDPEWNCRRISASYSTDKGKYKTQNKY
jgi:hypothetical protein